MRNQIKTAAAAAAVVAGLTGVAIAGGISAAAADPGSGTATEWCDESGNHQGWDTEEHGQLHDQMESHMTEFMGMGMGMNDGFGADSMDPGSGMGGLHMGRGSIMGR